MVEYFSWLSRGLESNTSVPAKLLLELLSLVAKGLQDPKAVSAEGVQDSPVRLHVPQL